MRLRTTTISLVLVFGSVLSAQSRPADSAIRGEINDAYQSMLKMWTSILSPRFAPPRIIYYTRPTETGCDRIDPGNAYFCEKDNAIYVDTAFIVDVDKQASAKFGSLGSYAGIAILAHELGHAVERNTSFAAHTTDVRTGERFELLPASEAVADCFSGAFTRQVKADGKLGEHDFDEALALMGLIGDDKLLGYNPNNPEQVQYANVVAIHIFHAELNHGTVVQRQEAFLRGFYGGPRFCTDGLGPPAPPPAGGAVLAHQSLNSAQVSTPTPGCTISSGEDGVRVHNTSAQNSCVINLLPASTLLPDHFRIELTVKVLPKGGTQPSGAGIYYGDGRSTPKLTRFGMELREPFGTMVSNIDGQPSVDDPLLAGLTLIRSGAKSTDGKQHLTLDVHHEGKNVYFLEYLNGAPVNHNALWTHGTRNQRLAVPGFTYATDQAGLSLREPGSEAVFSDFRVTALYR